MGIVPLISSGEREERAREGARPGWGDVADAAAHLWGERGGRDLNYLGEGGGDNAKRRETEFPTC